jgi:ABC-type multidrug transport system fused ATPase/permease subunit
MMLLLESFMENPILLLLSTIPIYYYGSSRIREAKIVKAWKKYVLDIKVLVPYLRPKDASDASYLTGLLIAVLSCIAIGRGINVYSPILLYGIIDRLSISDKKDAQFPWIRITVYIILRYALRDIMGFVQWIVSRRLEYQISDRISIAAYNKMMSLSASYHDNKDSTADWLVIKSSGNAVSRFICSVCFGIIPNFLDLFLGAIAFGNVCGAGLALILVLVLVLYVVALAKSSDPNSVNVNDLQDAVESRDQLASGTIQNWWTVYSFGKVGYEKERYSKAVDRQRDLDIRWCDSFWLSHNAKHSVMSFGIYLLMILVSRDVWHGTKSGGDIILFLDLWANLIQPVQDILDLNEKTQTFVQNIRHLIEMLQKAQTITDPDEAKKFQLESGSVEFDNVSFGYTKEAPKIQDLTLKIKGGQTLAIVGKSGGGKSTLLKLIIRSYDTTSGRILIDGQDIRELDRQSLIQHITMVPQKIDVFNVSVLENLRYAKLDATMEECQEVCQAVGLHEKIINSFEKGYEECIGEDGVKLSGGELQRLAIARALLKDAKIVLLDEATSNLDSETELKIQEYLKKWAVNRTVIIVAHRLASISHAHLIVAIKDGRIVESGEYKKLLTNKGYFYDLWNMQQLK